MQQAHFEEHERSTLVGLSGVYVLIDGVTPDLEAVGLHKSDVLNAIEEQLRSGGVAVLSRDQARASSGSPYLYVNVNVVQGAPDVYAHAVRMELNQGVYLERATHFRTVAATWQPAAVLASVRAGLADAVRQDIRAELAQFVNEYHDSNNQH